MGIKIDNPANILSNKMGAILSRDEPKDIFDIVSISEAYSFNWKDVYNETLKKQIADVTDIGMRISSFPIHWLENQDWLKTDINSKSFSGCLDTISSDLLFARDNSLGKAKPQLVAAQILSQIQ